MCRMKLINLKPKTENRKQKTKGKFKSPPCYILNLLTTQKKKKKYSDLYTYQKCISEIEREEKEEVAEAERRRR